MKRLQRVVIAAVLAGVTGSIHGLAAPTFADDAAVKLQGKESRRTELDALSYKPFDAKLLDKLAAWTSAAGGTTPAVNAAAMKGKPVVLVSFAQWYSTSLLGLAAAQKIAESNKDVVVIGVHHKRDFDAAKVDALLKERKISFPVAHDATGDVFSALKMEGAGPEIYVIDRAGNLRFASVQRDSLDEAIKIVASETAADAAKAKAPVRSTAAAKPTTAGGGGKGDAASGPDVPASAYASVKWPAANKGRMPAKNVQGKPLPVPMGKETYLAEKPSTKNKIVVVDFWATWCGPCKVAMPHLDKLQTQYKDDVVVIGVSDESEAVVRKFLSNPKNMHDYAQAVDPKANVKEGLEIQGIPHVIVMSSDGVVRWQGNPHPSADLKGLQETVEQLVKVDPGVLARKASKDKGEGAAKE